MKKRPLGTATGDHVAAPGTMARGKGHADIVGNGAAQVACRGRIFGTDHSGRSGRPTRNIVVVCSGSHENRVNLGEVFLVRSFLSQHPARARAQCKGERRVNDRLRDVGATCVNPRMIDEPVQRDHMPRAVRGATHARRKLVVCGMFCLVLSSSLAAAVSSEPLILRASNVSKGRD